MIYISWGFLLSIFKFYRKFVCVCVGVGWGRMRRKKASKEETPGTLCMLKSSHRNRFLPSFSFFFLLDVKKKKKKNLSRKQKPQYIIHQFGSCPCIFWKKSFFFLHVQIILILEVLRSDLRNRKFSGAQKLTWREERFFFFFKTFLKEWTSLHPEEKKTGILIYIYIYLYIFIECNFKVTLTPLSSGFRNVLLLLTLP